MGASVDNITVAVNRAWCFANRREWDISDCEINEYLKIYNEWRKENTETENKKAVNAVGHAVRCGKLIKRPCIVCGATENVQAHHWDYTKPLDVDWMCEYHHGLLHSLLKKYGIEMVHEGD